jgi:hypothetical protein
LFPPQPAEGAVGEGLRLLVLTLQELRQGRRQLLGCPPIGIALPAMPVAIAQPQLLVQPTGVGLGLLRPEGHRPDPWQNPS